MTSFRDPNAKSDRTQRRDNGGRVGRQGFERGWARSWPSARAGTAISAATAERQERRDQESAQNRHACLGPVGQSRGRDETLDEGGQHEEHDGGAQWALGVWA